MTFFQADSWHGGIDYARRYFYGLTILAVAGFFLSRALWQGETFAWISRVAVLGGLFLGLAGISLLHADYRFEGIQIAVHWANAALLTYVLVPLLAKPGRVEAVFGVLAAIALLTAMIGILQTHVGWSPYLTSAVAGSAFGNQNWAASVVNLTAAPAVYVFLQARAPLLRMGLALGLGLTGGFLLHTQTRSVWVALAVQAMVLGAGCWRWRNEPGVKPLWTRANALGLGIVLVISLLVGATDRAGWRFGGMPVSMAPAPSAGVQPVIADINVRSRLAAYENTLHLIAAHPLGGVGLYNFGLRLPETSPRNHELLFNGFFFEWANTHNDWLQLWSELGILFPLLVATAVFTLWRRYRTTGPSGAQPAAAVLISTAACTGCAVDMLFSFPLYLTVPPVLLAFHIAVIESHGLKADWPGSRWLLTGPRRGLAAVTVFSAVALVGLLAFFAQRQFAAEETRIAMGIAEGNDELQQVVLLAPRIGRIMPWEKEWLVHHGSACLRLAMESPRGRSDPDYRMRMLRTAEESLSTFLHFKTNRSYARYLLGFVLVGLGEPARAEVEFSKAAQLLPGNADILWERARVRLRLGNPEGAITDLREVSAARPADALRADAVLAPLLMKAKRLMEAIPVLERLRAADASAGKYREMLGICLIQHPRRTAEGMRMLRDYYADYGGPSPFRKVGEQLLQDYLNGHGPGEEIAPDERSQVQAPSHLR